MSDDDLLGYLFDALDPDDSAAVAARAEADPAVAARLELLRTRVGPLLAAAEVEQESPPEPRPGLAVRTLGRVAEYMVSHEPRSARTDGSGELPLEAIIRDIAAPPPSRHEFETLPSVSGLVPVVPHDDGPGPAPPSLDGPDLRATGGRFRADMLVAACIALVGVGLILSGVAKARYHNRVVACQENLRTLHIGLAGYADDNNGRYPQVGLQQTSDSFVTELKAYGHLPPRFNPGCPVLVANGQTPAYTYTLGFRGPNNTLEGLRRPGTGGIDPGAEHDLLPISADFPAAAAAPCSGPVSPHGNSMNVLFVGGNVRVTTSPLVGPNGDHIFQNVDGFVGAGRDRTDVVLGRPGDRP